MKPKKRKMMLKQKRRIKKKKLKLLTKINNLNRELGGLTNEL